MKTFVRIIITVVPECSIQGLDFKVGTNLRGH